MTTIVQKYEPLRDPLTKTKNSIMAVGNERFQVPEILFNPSDIGMAEASLPETISRVVFGLPEGLQPLLALFASCLD